MIIHKIDNRAYDDLFISRLNKIGKYPNGAMRYCVAEYNREIPNATSAAALLYAMLGMRDKSEILFNRMIKRQHKSGSWLFKFFNDPTKIRYEDSFHVSMVVYQMYMTAKMIHTSCNDTFKLSHKFLLKTNKKIQKKSIGWEIPMLYLAYICITGKSHDELKSIIITKSVMSENFRARAYAAWALVRGVELLGDSK